MNTDPTMNCIAFEVKRFLRRDHHLETVASQDEDGVRKAWLAVQAKTGTKPSQVRRIHTEWEPSATDREFIATTFSSPKVSYSFDRPEPGGWEAAFAAVAEQLEEALAQQVMAQAKAVKGSDANLYPVLRPAGSGMAQFAVHRPIGAGLVVCLAHVAWTPRKTIGTNWLMQGSVQDTEVDRLFEVAWKNLAKGLKVEGRSGEMGAIYTFEHPMCLAAGAIALPGFYENAVQATGAAEVVVGTPCLSHLFVAAANTPAAESLREIVLAAESDGELPPAVFRLDASGLYRDS